MTCDSVEMLLVCVHVFGVRMLAAIMPGQNGLTLLHSKPWSVKFSALAANVQIAGALDTQNTVIVLIDSCPNAASAQRGAKLAADMAEWAVCSKIVFSKVCLCTDSNCLRWMFSLFTATCVRPGTLDLGSWR